jgi:hypothetical protein
MNFIEALTALREKRCAAITISNAPKHLVIEDDTLFIQEIIGYKLPLNCCSVAWLLSDDWMLVNEKKITGRWINIYSNGTIETKVYESEEKAKNNAIIGYGILAKQVQLQEVREE